MSMQSLADTVDGLLQSEGEEKETKGKSGKEEPTESLFGNNSSLLFLSLLVEP